MDALRNNLIHHDVRAAFQAASHLHDEQAFFGPVNLLLNWYFSLERGFMVVPRTVPIGCDDETFVSVVEFDVKVAFQTVLIVLVYPHRMLSSVTIRNEADRKMRSRFGSEYQKCPIDPLRGIVFFGESAAFYEIDRSGAWKPPLPVKEDVDRVRTAPSAELWSNVITDADNAEDLLIDTFDRILRATGGMNQTVGSGFFAS